MNFLMKIDGTGFWPTWVAPAPASLKKEIEERLKASRKARKTASRKAPVKSARPA